MKFKNLKKQANISCGCLIIFAILAILFFIIGSTEDRKQPIVAPNIEKSAKEQQKESFIRLENELFRVSAPCDIHFDTAQKQLATNPIEAASNFNEAHYSCLDTMNNLKKIKSPDLLSDKQKELIEEALEDFKTAYALKYGAAKKAYKFLTKGNASDITKANDNIRISQDKILSGKSKLAKVKNELGVSP